MSGFINDFIDAEQRARADIAEGAAPGAARGRQYGATAGGYLGGAGGVALGTRAGVSLTRAGAATGQPVLAAGGAAAGLALARGGQVVGTQLGQQYGGQLGEAVGGLFDEPRPTSRPVQMPGGGAFSGGQCSGITYLVEIVVTRSFDGSTFTRSYTSWGPIRNVETKPDSGTTALFFPQRTTATGGYVDQLIGYNTTQNTLTGSIVNVTPNGSFAGEPDECGDPPGDPDYNTPRNPPRVTRDSPVGFPTRPSLPGGREPTPGVPGEDEPIEPYSPRLPGKPDNPGGPSNPTSPGPDGSPGSDDPGPELPKPPAPPEDCDPCPKIDSLRERMEQLFAPSSEASINLQDCQPEEGAEEPPAPGDGETQGGSTGDGSDGSSDGHTTTVETIYPTTVTPKTVGGSGGSGDEPGGGDGDTSNEPSRGALAANESGVAWSGEGLQGIYNALEAIGYAVGTVHERVKCLETGNPDPIVIYPNDVYSEFTLEGRLTLEFSTLDAYPKPTSASSKWSLDIPNPLAEYDWATHFEDFRLAKGSWYGRCIWSDSGVRSGAYCANYEEAQKLIAYIQTLTASVPKRERITDSGRTGLSTAQLRIVRAVKTTISGGQVVDATCYKPPSTQP